MLKKLSLMTLMLASVPGMAMACACGCGVFEVGTGSMLPDGQGGRAWLEYDFMNQEINWSGSKVAPEAGNDDKRLRTQYYTAGAEYMFNRSWGVETTVPYVRRYYRTEDGGAMQSFKDDGLGDIKVEGIYTGISDDMSTGLKFGLKLPTGDHSVTGFDRDTAIGSGSTDLLLGAYHQDRFAFSQKLSWFVNGQWEHAFLTQSDYRPGDEFSAAAGIYYEAGSIAGYGKFSPLLQIIGSDRQRDSGGASDPDNSGYTRLVVSPGVEYDLYSLKLYGDVGIPVYQNVNGNQLTPPVLFKFIVAHDF
ncbi:MAG TPA: hypothetical protein VFT64_07465 [Rickettsiales bacterium]|nr:hypothetical protein [Rickettsiales bacterium]